MKICVVGAGYVGLSLAVLFSQKYNTFLLDSLEDKVALINKKKSPFNDKVLEEFLENKKLNLKASTSKDETYTNSKYIVIATPTNYNPVSGDFDTLSVESVISDILKINSNATIIIKSTIPPGFTNKMRSKFQKDDIFFSPEFLRERKALYDNLYPSRVVIGGYSEEVIKFGEMLIECSNKKKDSVNVYHMTSTEAESVKLFSNTFLAMRISFFNELDSFAEMNSISVERIINGVCSDPRIGNYYNNPSFGYGGYCLPKDTKQLLKSYDKIPNKIIKATVESNITRKEFIVQQIIKKKPKLLGVHRLVMKEGSDNFRDSAILDIIKGIKKENIKIIIYEPIIKDEYYYDCKVENNIKIFMKETDLIITNRYSKELEDVNDKIYSRDIFNEN